MTFIKFSYHTVSCLYIPFFLKNKIIILEQWTALYMTTSTPSVPFSKPLGPRVLWNVLFSLECTCSYPWLSTSSSSYSLKYSVDIVVVVQSLSHVWLLQPHGLQHARLLCPSLSPTVCSNSSPLVLDVIQPSHPLSPSSPLAPNLSQHFPSLFI